MERKICLRLQCAAALLFAYCGSSMGCVGTGRDAGPAGPGLVGTPGVAGPAGPGLSGFLDATQVPACPHASGGDWGATITCVVGQLPPCGSSGFDALPGGANLGGMHCGTVYLPPGVFAVTTTIQVPENVSMVGAGDGTVIYQPHSFPGPVFVLGNQSQLHQMQLMQEQPAPAATWEPYVYDYQIVASGDKADISDLMLLNPYKGILVAGLGYPAPIGAVGQTTISNIRGEPLFEGIRVDGDLDVMRVDNLHFWPFWSIHLMRYAGAGGPVAWTLAHGTGIVSLRNDNPMFSRLFFYSYRYGIHFGRSPATVQSNITGITSAAVVSMIDCDGAENCVIVDGEGTQGLSISQLGGGNPTGSGGAGLLVAADSVSVRLENSFFGNMWANAVRVQGNNSTVLVTGTMVRDWNRSGLGYPAFELVTGVSGSALFVTSSLAEVVWGPLCSANVNRCDVGIGNL